MFSPGRRAWLLAAQLLVTLSVSAQGTSGVVQSEQQIGDLIGGFTVDLEDFDRFGVAATRIGDRNGDGYEELAVGAPGDDDGGPDQGAVYVLYPTSSGTVIAHVKIAENQGGFSGQLDPSDRFGSSVALVGDVNLDGVADLAVGATGDDDGGSDQGAVWILFLTSGGTVQGFQKISATQGNFNGALAPFDFFGTALAGLGDLNGDGRLDLAVGARGTDAGGMDRGAVWVLLLGPGGQVAVPVQLTTGVGGFTGVLDNTDWFGASLAMPGDLNGDSHPDLVIGAPLDDDGAADSGALWVVMLQASGNASAHHKLSNGAAGMPALAAGDAFGSSVAAAGDLNADGFPDLLVGAPHDDAGGSGLHANRGAAHVLRLGAATTIVGHQKISDVDGGFQGQLTDSSGFGAAVAVTDDLNGDGLPEMLVGAVGDFPTTSQGSLWVLFPAPVLVDCNGNGVADSADIASGSSVDLNADGIPDECQLAPEFVRGDCDASGGSNLADAVFLLGYLFPVGAANPVNCQDACDGNDDGALNLSDAIVLLGALFGMPPAPLPGPASCGPDAVMDTLDCASFASCP